MENKYIIKAYWDAVIAKGDYECRIKYAPTTGKLWSRYVASMIELIRLVKENNNAR